MLWRMKKFI
jgi:D-alanyl-D-alanine carboxypeptidase